MSLAYFSPWKLSIQIILNRLSLVILDSSKDAYVEGFGSQRDNRWGKGGQS